MLWETVMNYLETNINVFITTRRWKYRRFQTLGKEEKSELWKLYGIRKRG